MHAIVSIRMSLFLGCNVEMSLTKVFVSVILLSMTLACIFKMPRHCKWCSVSSFEMILAGVLSLWFFGVQNFQTLFQPVALSFSGASRRPTYRHGKTAAFDCMPASYCFPLEAKRNTYLLFISCPCLRFPFSSTILNLNMNGLWNKTIFLNK